MISHRKPWRLVVTALFLVVATQVCLARAHSAHAWKRNYQEAEAEARRLDRPLLLHFGATWCGPCKQMESQVLNTPDVRRVLKDSIVGVKIDIDENPALAQRYGIDSVPADVIISPAGQILVAKTAGGLSRDAYVAKLMGGSQAYIASRTIQSQPAIVQTTPRSPSQPSATAPVQSEPSRPAAPSLTKTPVIAMEGYCPVTLWRTREWIKGSKKYGADYQGVRYYFQSLDDRNDFIAEPTRYAPQLLGCDPVLLQETERAVAGTPKFAAYFDGSLYLFADIDHRVRFKATPEQYTHTRHVNLEDIERSDTRLGMNN